MNSNLLKRLEKVEKAMNPPDIPKYRIEIIFVRPDRTISGRRILDSGEPDLIIQEGDEDDTDYIGSSFLNVQTRRGFSAVSALWESPCGLPSR